MGAEQPVKQPKVTGAAVGWLPRNPGALRAMWSGLDAAATPLASLATTAGLTRFLGSEDYGLLVLVLALSGLSTAINPAIVVTTTKFVSEAMGLGQKATKDAVARVVTASLMAVVAIDLLLLAGTGLFIRPLPALVFGGAIAAVRSDIGGILLIAMLVVCIQQIDGVLSAAIRGLERFQEQATLEIGLRLMTAAVVTSAGWLTRDLQVVLIANCGAGVVAVALRATVLRSLAPHARIFAMPTRADLSRIFVFGRWMWLNAIATAAYGTVDRIIVGRVLGAAAAGEFNVYIQISQLIHYVPSSLFAFTFPVFSRLGVDERAGRAAIVSLYRKHLVLIIGTAGLIAASVTFSRHALFRALGGAAFQGNHQTAFMLLVLSFLFLSFNVAPYYLLLGLGRARQVSLITSTSMFAALVLTMVLAPSYGLEGAALARFGYVFGTLILLERAHRTLQEP